MLRLKKARALILYLLLEPGREHRESLVMGIFWEDVPNAKSRTHCAKPFAIFAKSRKDVWLFQSYVTTMSKVNVIKPSQIFL
jgi:hypothetical protein